MNRLTLFLWQTLQTLSEAAHRRSAAARQERSPAAAGGGSERP